MQFALRINPFGAEMPMPRSVATSEDVPHFVALDDEASSCKYSSGDAIPGNKHGAILSVLALKKYDLISTKDVVVSL